MVDLSSLPPPSGPRLGGPGTGLSPSPAAAASSAAPSPVRTSSPSGLWAAPPSAGAGKASSPIARATTAESLALAIPELTGSIELDLPGAAVPVALTGLNGVKVQVLVNGSRVKPSGFNTVSVPLVDGTKGKIRIGGFPGYPVVKFKGQVVYRHPKPPAWEFALMFLTLVAPIFGLLGGIVPILIGFGSLYAHALMVKRGVNVWVRVLLPLAVAIGWIVLGFVLIDFYF